MVQTKRNETRKPVQYTCPDCGRIDVRDPKRLAPFCIACFPDVEMKLSYHGKIYENIEDKLRSVRMPVYWYKATGTSGLMVCWHENRKSVYVQYAEPHNSSTRVMNISTKVAGHQYIAVDYQEEMEL